MEIKDLILLFWRNVRYIALGVVLGASIGIGVLKIQAPVYEATTKIFVSQMRQQSNPDMLLLSDEQLLAINLQLAKSQPVLNDVSSQLGSKVDADNILAGAIPNTLIIQIKVQDVDPQRAAKIGNLLVQTLINQNETLLSERYVALEVSISEQIDQVQKQIDELQTQISQINDTDIQEQLVRVNQQIAQIKKESSGLEQEIAGAPLIPTPVERISLAEKQAQLDQLRALMTLYQQIQTNLTYIGKPGPNGSSLENPQLTTLQSTLTLYQQIHQTLVNRRENIRLAHTQSKQNVMQIVSATPPKNPTRPIPVLYIVLSGGVGLALAAIVILLINHLDDSLKTTLQIEKLLGLPVLGYIFENKHNNKIVTPLDPHSADADAFSTFGANLEIAGAGKSIRTLMIVNAESDADKTSIAANLALVNAQQGKHVILLDGDLKHPNLHSLFEMENEKGFAELLDERVEIKYACHPVKDMPGIFLIPAGTIEEDRTGWLNVEKLTRLLSVLLEKSDFVIVDGPPADAADAQILASMMDAVLLTVRVGHTRVDSAQSTLRRFQSIGARVTGAVFYRNK